MDFVWSPRKGSLLALECQWSARDFDPAGLLAFARNYPKAKLLVVVTDAAPGFIRDYYGQMVEFVGLNKAVVQLTEIDRDKRQ